MTVCFSFNPLAKMPKEFKSPEKAELLLLTMKRAKAQPPGGAEKPKAAVDADGDPLPPGVVARLGTLRWRHDSSVTALVYSPDGKILAGRAAGQKTGLRGFARVHTGWHPAPQRHVERLDPGVGCGQARGGKKVSQA